MTETYQYSLISKQLKGSLKLYRDFIEDVENSKSIQINNCWLVSPTSFEKESERLKLLKYLKEIVKSIEKEITRM